MLGLLKGSDPAVAEETVIVGAHYDHVGVRQRGDDDTDVAEVFNGANDNASGVAGVLEIAEAMTKLPQAPRRSILFALWDGEERGFVGSRFFVDHPTRGFGSSHRRPGDRHDWPRGRQSTDRVGNRHRRGLARHHHRQQRRATTERRVATVHAGIVGSPALLCPRHSGDSPVLRACFPNCIARRTTSTLLNPDGMRRATQLLHGVVCDLANREDRLVFVEAARGDVERDPLRKE